MESKLWTVSLEDSRGIKKEHYIVADSLEGALLAVEYATRSTSGPARPVAMRELGDVKISPGVASHLRDKYLRPTAQETRADRSHVLLKSFCEQVARRAVTGGKEDCIALAANARRILRFIGETKEEATERPPLM